MQNKSLIKKYSLIWIDQPNRKLARKDKVKQYNGPVRPNWYLKDISPQNNEFHLFSSAHRTFSRIDHILGHKSSLGKFRKIEIISSIFSDHNAVRLDVNYRKKKTINNKNIWRLNNTFMNNQQITEEIKKEIKICI